MDPHQIDTVTAPDPTRLAHRESASSDPPPPAFGLSPREFDVVALLVEGRSNAEIGHTLGISSRTAAVHVSRILRKLSVSNRAAVVSIAIRRGLVPAG